MTSRITDFCIFVKTPGFKSFICNAHFKDVSQSQQWVFASTADLVLDGAIVFFNLVNLFQPHLNLAATINYIIHWEKSKYETI